MLLSLLVLVAVLLAFPETDVGRSLSALLVEAPARVLARVTRGHLLLIAAVGVFGLAMFIVFEADGLRLFGMLLPELGLWFALFDVALFVDVFLVAAALAATIRYRALRDQAILALQGVRARVSARRAGRSRSKRPRRASVAEAGSDDPDPAWGGFALAG